MSEHDAERIRLHLTSCAPCRRASDRLAGIGRALAPRREEVVPDRVIARAGAAIGDRERADRPKALDKRRTRGAVAIAVGAVAAAIAVFAAPPGLQPAMADELVTHHVSGFARERPCDFESSEPEAVSRWVENSLGYRIDVAPPEGAHLLGVRTCSIDGVKTAALMYRRASGEPLTVFVPPEGSSASSEAARLAHGGVGCARAPLGSTVCGVARGPALAVAETDRESLERTLTSTVRRGGTK